MIVTDSAVLPTCMAMSHFESFRGGEVKPAAEAFQYDSDAIGAGCKTGESERAILRPYTLPSRAVAGWVTIISARGIARPGRIQHNSPESCKSPIEHEPPKRVNISTAMDCIKGVQC